MTDSVLGIPPLRQTHTEVISAQFEHPIEGLVYRMDVQERDPVYVQSVVEIVVVVANN
jgi:hypothetical protein